MRRALGLGTVLALLAIPVGFVSQAAAAATPSVSTGGASAITSSVATVSGSVNPNGSSTVYSFQYGTSTQLGQQTALLPVGDDTTTHAVSAALGSLQAGTTYYYRTIATNDAGTATGTTLTFSTPGTPPPAGTRPIATTGTAQAGVNSANLHGFVSPNGLTTTFYFEFGTTAAYGSQTAPVSAGSSSDVFPVSTSLGGLQSSKTYHFRIVATSAAGTTVGADATFKTLSPPPTTSYPSLFGHTAFVAPQGVGGIFVGCIGQTTCRGTSMTIVRRGSLLGQRQSFTIAQNNGGIVHFTLNHYGQSLLIRYGQLPVTVTVKLSGGRSVSANVTLVRFL